MISLLNQQNIISEIDATMEKYCDGCFVKQQLRKDRGKQRAHQFCIESCTVGEQLQFLGQELLKIHSKE